MALTDTQATLSQCVFVLCSVHIVDIQCKMHKRPECLYSKLSLGSHVSNSPCVIMSSNPQQGQGHWRRVGNSNSLEWVSTVQDLHARRIGNHALSISNSSSSQAQHPSASSSSELQIPSRQRKGISKPPRVQHDGNHILHISKPSTSMLPPSASSSSNPHTTSRRKDIQAAAASLAHPVVALRNQPHQSRKGTSELGSSGSNDPSVPEFVRNALDSLLTDGQPQSPPLENASRTRQSRKRARRSSGIDANTELERLGFGSSFFETIGIPTTMPDPIFPPHTIPADKIRAPPVIPKKPKLHERHGQIRRDVNSGMTWLYRIQDTSTMHPSPQSPPSIFSSGLANYTLSAPLDNQGPPRPDSPLPQADSASWNPIMTLEDEGLNRLFVDHAPASMPQHKSRGSTSRASLAQRWNELIPRLIAPFMRRVAATHWDATSLFDACLPACIGGTCCPKTLSITCIRAKSKSR